MSENARCKNCENAQWERTPTGRIKSKTAGRCRPDLPQLPILMAATQQPSYQPGGIWPDREGRCDFFKEKP